MLGACFNLKELNIEGCEHITGKQPACRLLLEKPMYSRCLRHSFAGDLGVLVKWPELQKFVSRGCEQIGGERSLRAPLQCCCNQYPLMNVLQLILAAAVCQVTSPSSPTAPSWYNFSSAAAPRSAVRNPSRTLAG